MQQKRIICKGLNGSDLKLIAIITMLIDHIGAVLLEKFVLLNIPANTPDYTFYARLDILLRMIGRISFPIFCFLLVEGALHTRNQYKYAVRLFLFSILSEIPFDLAVFQEPFNWNYQNVFFTLFFGLCVLIGWSWIRGHSRMDYLLRGLVLAAGMLLAFLFKTDYGAFGVFFIAILYGFRENKFYRNILGAIIISFEITAPLAFILIHFYNGKRGISLKYIFYLFYPVHLLFLYYIGEIFFV